MRRVEYTDVEGRHKVVLLPEEVSASEARIGVPVGPPVLAQLDLPLDIEVRLNNELFYRGIITTADAIKKRSEVLAAIQSTFKVDADRIISIYMGRDISDAHKEPPKEQPDKTVPDRGQSESR